MSYFFPAPLRNAAGFFYLCINRPILIRNNRLSACFPSRLGRFFRSIPDLAVFRRFPGLLRSGWHNLSSAP